VLIWLRHGTFLSAFLTGNGRAEQEHSYVILRIPKNLHERQNPKIMKKILLDTLTSFRANLRNSTNYASSPHGLLLIPLILVCFALGRQVQAAGDTPDPGPKPVSNTADGQNALLSITTGIHNTAIGFDSLLSNTDANFNTGVGSASLVLNTAAENTAVGAGALLSNTIGDQNTANGAFALFTNTEGIRNTAIGARTLLSNTLGERNVAIGPDALGANLTGAFNVAIGGSALIDNTAGDDNTAIGVGTLNQVTGTGNTGLGRLAGNEITSGNNIIAIGSVGGLSTTNGQVDDSCYIDNIIGAGVDAVTAMLVAVDQDGKLGTVALPGTGTLPWGQPQAMLNRKVEELQATVAQLTQQIKEQAAQIQKVSAQLEVSKPAAQVANYEQ
jgi:hypothetical protein